MKVKFLPQNIELEIKPNQSVMELAHSNGVSIKSVCNGMPSCAECRVRVVDGEYNILPPSSKELSLIGTGHFIDQRRLSCQIKCFGDVVIDLAEQVEKSKKFEQKRPQGNLRKDDAEVSRAITGSLIEQEGELIQQTQAEVDNRDRHQGRPPQRDQNREQQRGPQDQGQGPRRDGRPQRRHRRRR